MKETVHRCDRCGNTAPTLQVVTVPETRGRMMPHELCPSCFGELVAWLGPRASSTPVVPPPVGPPLAGPGPQLAPPAPAPLAPFQMVGQPSPGPVGFPAPGVQQREPLAPFSGPQSTPRAPAGSPAPASSDEPTEPGDDDDDDDDDDDGLPPTRP